jgi:glycosyltransferase family protein
MPKYPFVEEEFETVRTIIRERASISRYGDGELRCAIDGSCSSQKGDPKLAEKLRRILKNDIKGLLVGIPRSVERYDWAMYNSKKAGSWVKYRTHRFGSLLDPSKKYYSSFITRSDNAFHINCKQYWDLCKVMWDKRNVVFIQGEEKPIAKTKDLFGNISSSKIIIGPSHHAFDEYEKIKNEAKKHYEKNVLFILALGAAATVLACDIHLDGYQALDLGHMGAFYGNIFKEKPGLEKIEKEAISNDQIYNKELYK